MTIYDKFNFSHVYREELTEFLKHNTNAEIGGYRLFDGMRTHLMQNPYELCDLIIALKRYEKEREVKLSTFLEIGFSSGITNTILNKFFSFEKILAIDNFSAEINGNTLKANLMFKPLTLLCGDSTSPAIIDSVKREGSYDLIFIDACHSYESVKQDFINYSPLLNRGGIIALHDIDSPLTPGINRFWNELKDSGRYIYKEFVCKDYAIQYGIGMVWIK